MIFFLLFLLLLYLSSSPSLAAGIGRRKSEAVQRRQHQKQQAEEELDGESRALNATLSKLHTEGEHGRLVLLVCRAKCLRERTLIPGWVREFNGRQNRSLAAANQSDLFDPLGFHFHQQLRRPIPVPDIAKAMKTRQTVLFYVVAGRIFPVEMPAGKKNQFVDWLDSFERPQIALVDDGNIDEWLNSECHGEGGMVSSRRIGGGQQKTRTTLLVVHDPELCPESLLRNFARALLTPSNSSSMGHHPHFLVAEMQRPLSEDMELILHWRLNQLSGSCRMDILLHDSLYMELPSSIVGSELYGIGANLSALPLDQNCSYIPPVESAGLQRILPPLNPIELEYMRDERQLLAIEHNRQYLTVGAIGGVAVMALAMSIFWGLNGNDFV